VGPRREFFEVKREFERIHLEHALPARLSGNPVSVLDLAVGGARLIGSVSVTPASIHELSLDWEGKTIRAKCSITRCVMRALDAYEIGVRILETSPESDRMMHHLIATYVLQAIDEQRANWEGKPPIGPYVYIEGKSDRYKRCELVNGEWQVQPTRRPEQPTTGFTVSVEVPPHLLNMLRETYEMTDDEGRRLLRILAELSINKAEGIPTRRYIP
jgi:hypothetical protein